MTKIDLLGGAGADCERQVSFLRFFQLYAKWTLFRRARSDLACLAAMSECERRDIGLTGAFDIANAFALPVEGDPTDGLAHIAEDDCLRECRPDRTRLDAFAPSPRSYRER